MHRSQILEAPYNPRDIDDWKRQKLKQKIQKHGLVNKLVWNEKTGRLVGGHQRLSILDELEGGTDYDLEVDAVTLSEKAERQVNGVLNNRGLQGDWNLEKLAAMLQGDEALEPEDLGFDRLEVEEMFVDTGLLTSLFDEPEDVADQVEAVRSMSPSDRGDDDDPDADGVDDGPRLKNGQAVRDPEKVASTIADRAQMREKLANVNADAQTDFFVVVVFGTFEEREAAMVALGKPGDEKYIDGRELMHRLKVPLPKTERA